MSVFVYIGSECVCGGLYLCVCIGVYMCICFSVCTCVCWRFIRDILWRVTDPGDWSLVVVDVERCFGSGGEERLNGVCGCV